MSAETEGSEAENSEAESSGSRRVRLHLGEVQLAGAAPGLALFTRTWVPSAPLGTIVCLHGYTDNSSDFSFFGEAAARAGYQVVCPDWPGRGRSRWLPAPRYEMGLYRSAMAALVAGARPPVTVLASSWSTLIALPYLAAPSRPLASAVLIDATLRSGPAFERFVAASAAEAAMTFRGVDDLRAYLAETRPSVQALPVEDQERYALRRAAYVDGALRIDCDPQLGAKIEELRGVAFDATGLASGVRVPTLFLHGRDGAPAAALAEPASRNPRVILRDYFPSRGPLLLDAPRHVEEVIGFMEREGPGSDRPSPRAPP